MFTVLIFAQSLKSEHFFVQIEACMDNKSCADLAASCEELNAANFTGVLTVETKERAMNAIRMHHGFYKFLPALVQFRAGGEQIKLHTQVKLGTHWGFSYFQFAVSS